MKKEVKLKSSGSDTIYCPVCGIDIKASNIDEVESGSHKGYIFIHDKMIHSESDMDALSNGVQ